MINKVFSGRDIHESEVSDLFVNYTKFKSIQEQQKKRGLNDYNLFTSLLDKSDEVRLHTRFICSLLNPEGNHFQDDLFLEKFISAVGINNFGLNTKNAKVFREYEYIDLYITDGDKHIIIENKIYASDQDRQISNYIEKIQTINKIPSDNLFEKIFVIYLSLDRESPSSVSIPGYVLQSNALEKNGIRVGFKSIHYISEVMVWLDECQKEVANLTNLNLIINQYRDVVLLINNKYKGKIMSIKEFLSNDVRSWMIFDELGKQHDALLYDICKELSEKIYFHIQSNMKNNTMLDKVEVLRRDSYTFLYAGDIMCVNLHLDNKIILQLTYDSLFNIKRILVQFFLSESRKGEDQVSIPYTFSSTNDKAPYELIFNDNNLKHLLDMHDQSFIKKIDSIIDEYK